MNFDNKNGNLKITLNKGLDDLNIDFLQQLEAEIEESLAKLGFAKLATTKGSTETVVEFFQFCIAL